MTEQEYCDLTDLQLARAAIRLINQMNCFDSPNRTYWEESKAKLRKIIDNLEPKISKYMDDE